MAGGPWVDDVTAPSEATICKQECGEARRGEGESDVLFKGPASSVDKGVQDGASEQVCVSE